MEFLKDEGQRKYCLFLVLVLAMASVLGMAVWYGNGQRIKEMALKHDRRVVSSLMNQGVSEAVIAKAFAEEQITEEGKNLLGRMGISEGTEVFFMPGIAGIQKGMGLWLAGLFFFGVSQQVGR